MRESCRKPAMFAFYDRAKIVQTLERMSEQGWVLEKPGAFYWKYRQAEPKHRHVSVLYVSDASEFNSGPTRSQELLEELGTADGWTLVASWGQMQIYYSEESDPAPMETDPATQVEAVHRAMAKGGIQGAWLHLADGVLMEALILWQLCRDPVMVLSQGFMLWLLPDGLLMILSALIDLVGWRLWYRKAVAAAERGVYLEVWNFRAVSWILSTASVLVLGLTLLGFAGRIGLLVIALIPVLLTHVLVSRLMDFCRKRGYSKRANLAVTLSAAVACTLLAIGIMAFAVIHFHVLEASKPVGTYQKYGREWDVYQDDLPLRLEDFEVLPETDWSLEKRGRGTFLVSSYDYLQWPLSEQKDLFELRYTMTDVKLPALYDLCRNSILQSQQDEVQHGEVLLVNHYEPINAADWGAEAAWQLRWDDSMLEKYVLCYGNRIVELDLVDAPTAQQRQLIAERLKP